MLTIQITEKYGRIRIYIQSFPFDHVTCDWNNDGEIYSVYGAYFMEDGVTNYREFFTYDEIFDNENIRIISK